MKNKFKLSLIFVCVLIFWGYFAVPAEAVSVAVTGYAWSSNIGWIQIDPIHGGVSLDNATGNFSGYGWSSNIGWINFSGVTMKTANGKVEGVAMATAAGGGWDGQIVFRGNSPNYGVNVDLSTGVFSGYAWGSDVVGWVSMNGPGYAVKTSSSTVLPTVKITADNTDLQSPNNGTTLRWSYTNADSCRLDPPIVSISVPSGGTGSGNTDTGSMSSPGRTFTIYCDPGPVRDSVAVNVAVQQIDLTIIKLGQGKITSVSAPSDPSQAEFNCGTGCAKQTISFPQGTEVTLTAFPSIGRIFTGWSSGCNSSKRNADGSGSCVVNINSGQTITANFAPDPNYKEF